MKTRNWVSCLWITTILAAGCTGDNEDGEIVVPEASTPAPGDGAVEANASGDGASSAEAADTSNDADGGEANDEAAADGSLLNDASDATAADADAMSDASPLGDGAFAGDSALPPADAATSDAVFQLTNLAGTNLISPSNLGAVCSVAIPQAGTYVMTCEERGTNGCRTVEVAFARNPNAGPTTGDVFVASVGTSPTLGQALVRYRESPGCSAMSTNGWIQAQQGGDLTIDLGADTAFNFTLHAVGMGPSPNGSENMNAQGTFTLTGSGKAYGTF